MLRSISPHDMHSTLLLVLTIYHQDAHHDSSVVAPESSSNVRPPSGCSFPTIGLGNKDHPDFHALGCFLLWREIGRSKGQLCLDLHLQELG